MTQWVSGLSCVVDTCALRHWKNIELKDIPLEKWIEREFNVHTSETIVDEIANQEHFWGPGAKQAKKKVKQWARKLTNPEHIENALLSDFVTEGLINTVEGAGERRNFCVAVDLVRKNKYGYVIFLTDDERAIDGFLKQAFSAFGVACIWNSLDLILYLYVRHHRSIPLSIAKDVVRDLISNFTKDAASSRKLQIKLTDYHVRLDRVSSALGKLSD